MNMKLVVGIAGLMVAATVPLLAHHSFAAEYDANAKLTLKGTVTKVDWMNPHIWVYVDAKDESGKMIHWQCEGGAPNTLQQMRELLSERDARIEALEKTVAELRAAVSHMGTHPQNGSSFAP